MRDELWTPAARAWFQAARKAEAERDALNDLVDATNDLLAAAEARVEALEAVAVRVIAASDAWDTRALGDALFDLRAALTTESENRTTPQSDAEVVAGVLKHTRPAALPERQEEK